MFLTQTVAPTALPLPLTELRRNLRLDDETENALVAELAMVAARVVQERTGKAIGAQTWRMDVKAPISDALLRLPLVPVTAVTTMTYQDENDAQQNLTVSDFYLFSDEDKAYLKPKDGVSWPVTYDRPDALSVTFTAGFATVPRSLKQAIQLLTAHYFENREAATARPMAALPLGVAHLVDLERIGWIGA